MPVDKKDVLLTSAIREQGERHSKMVIFLLAGPAKVLGVALLLVAVAFGTFRGARWIFENTPALERPVAVIVVVGGIVGALVVIAGGGGGGRRGRSSGRRSGRRY